jgi:hypothetical protein
MLQEVEFELQDLEDVAFVGHVAPPHLERIVARWEHRGCDLRHGNM